jgi:hypothetical protein
VSAPLRLIWIVLVLGGAAALSVQWRSFVVARSAAQAQAQRAGIVAAQVQNLAGLEPLTHAWAARKRPESGLAARLGDTLAACGLPPSALSAVSPQPEVTLSGPDQRDRLNRQRAGFTLAPVTLPQLGAFLEAWRAREPYWTVASIDLAPDTSDKAAPGRDLPLRATIALDAVYLDQKGADR